jgi:choline kinase
MIPPPVTRNRRQGPRKVVEPELGEETGMYRGLIAAAGLSTRLQDLGDKRNKVLLDLGGTTLLQNILNHFDRGGISPTYVVVGFGAPAVHEVCHHQATCILNPFFEHYGILGSIWLARPHLDGQAFVFTTGDHYFAWPRFEAFLADQPTAEILADVEIKACDDEDMKVYVNRAGEFRTMTKTFLKKDAVLGEFTATVRFSPDGSRQFFETLEKHVWQHGIQGYLADVLCTYQRKWELSFHLSTDHRRVEVDFPCDVARARALYKEHEKGQLKVAN